MQCNVRQNVHIDKKNGTFAITSTTISPTLVFSIFHSLVLLFFCFHLQLVSSNHSFNFTNGQDFTQSEASTDNAFKWMGAYSILVSSSNMYTLCLLFSSTFFKSILELLTMRVCTALVVFPLVLSRLISLGAVKFNRKKTNETKKSEKSKSR